MEGLEYWGQHLGQRIWPVKPIDSSAIQKRSSIHKTVMYVISYYLWVYSSHTWFLIVFFVCSCAVLKVSKIHKKKVEDQIVSRNNLKFILSILSLFWSCVCVFRITIRSHLMVTTLTTPVGSTKIWFMWCWMAAKHSANSRKNSFDCPSLAVFWLLKFQGSIWSHFLIDFKYNSKCKPSNSIFFRK